MRCCMAAPLGMAIDEPRVFQHLAQAIPGTCHIMMWKISLFQATPLKVPRDYRQRNGLFVNIAYLVVCKYFVHDEVWFDDYS